MYFQQNFADFISKTKLIKLAQFSAAIKSLNP